MYISFTHPLYLIFLFVIPILIFFHFYGLKNIKGKTLKFANFEAIARVKGIDIYSKSMLVLIFNTAFIILLVLSLSGLTLHKEVDASSFSFVIAIDNSESMSAIDLEPSRLAAAKQSAVEFVESLPYESYVGVISFAGDSYIEQALTKNKQEIKYGINNIEISGIGGTDVFEAVSNSAKILENEGSKAVILLSDGQINIGNVGETIDYAKYNDVMIHTFGIGTIEGGEVSYGLSKLDEDSLKSLAYNTEGRYFNVKDEGEMKKSFGEIIGVTEKLGSVNLSIYLIITCIALFIVKQFLITINKMIW